MITETDREALRELMPELLNVRCGITGLRRTFRCPSPNHDDRDPSAHYYENNNTMHCFGCGKTWDVFSLIAELDGIDGFAEQARAGADDVGYRLSDDDEPRRPRRGRSASPGSCLTLPARQAPRTAPRRAETRSGSSTTPRTTSAGALPALARAGRRRCGDLRARLHEGSRGNHAGVPCV